MTGGSPLRRRRIVLLLIVAVTIVLSLSGLWASTWVRSPQQVAAEAEAPPLSVITAPVEFRELRETVVLRGEVFAGTTMDVHVESSEVMRSVVTKAPLSRDDEVSAGTVALEVSGRPVIVLPGAVPSYRDLSAGDNGPDVVQLQAALRTVGYGITDTEGVFGPSTERAVRGLYEARGYQVAQPAPIEDDEGPVEDTGPSPLVLPMNELVYVPELPAVVTRVNTGLGDPVDEDPVLELSLGELVVHGVPAPAQVPLISEGMPALVLAEELDTEVEGEVTAVHTTDADDDPEAQGEVTITVRGKDDEIPEDFSGMNVRLTIESASSGSPVLAVPSSAVYGTADGETRVIRLNTDGTEESITVTTGTSGDGFVEVRSPDLDEGDLLVVGR